jgi:hypothetical protein
MIYTISQHKVNTQCLNEYSKSLKEVKSSRQKALSLSLQSCDNVIKKGLNCLPLAKACEKTLTNISRSSKSKLLTLSKIGSKAADFSRTCHWRSRLRPKNTAVVERQLLQRPSKKQKAFSSNIQTNIQLLTTPFVLQSYSKVRSRILRKLQHNNLALHFKNDAQISSLKHENRGYEFTVTGGLQPKEFFSGVLLFSREDLAFINLRSLLSSLLKALHVCLFATLNNKRIIFVGDPQPLVQEHHQRLLSCFIGSQIKAFTTKMTELLPPLPHSLGKVSSLSLTDYDESNGVNPTLSLRSQKRAKFFKKSVSKPLAFHQASTANYPLTPTVEHGVGCKTLMSKNPLFSNLHALLKNPGSSNSESRPIQEQPVHFYEICSEATNEKNKSASVDSPIYPQASRSAKVNEQNLQSNSWYGHEKNFADKKSTEKSLADCKFALLRSQPAACNGGFSLNKSLEKNGTHTKLRPILSTFNFSISSSAKQAFLKKGSATSLGPSKQGLHDKLLRKVQKAALKTTLTFRLKPEISRPSELYRPAMDSGQSLPSVKSAQPLLTEKKRGGQSQLFLTEKQNFYCQKSMGPTPHSIGLDVNNGLQMSMSQFAETNAHTKVAESNQTSHGENLIAERQSTGQPTGAFSQKDYFFYTGMAKLVSKAAIRNSQWTASLAQPTNYWIGGFFSNNLATYKQKLSSTTLLNIKMDPESQLEDFQDIYYENRLSKLPFIKKRENKSGRGDVNGDFRGKTLSDLSQKPGPFEKSSPQSPAFSKSVKAWAKHSESFAEKKKTLSQFFDNKICSLRSQTTLRCGKGGEKSTSIRTQAALPWADPAYSKQSKLWGEDSKHERQSEGQAVYEGQRAEFFRKDVWAVTKTGELFFDKSFFHASTDSKHLLYSVGDSTFGLWNAIYTPVARKDLSENLEAIDANIQRKKLLKSFHGQIPAKINPFKKQPLNIRKLTSRSNQTALKRRQRLRRKGQFHKKAINHCLHSMVTNKATNAWLKEADLVFFANPEKTLSLLNQINRLKIPTLGILNSGSNLAFPFRSVKGSSLLSAKPTINYPIMGNSNSLNFLRIVLTKFACVLNKKRA